MSEFKPTAEALADILREVSVLIRGLTPAEVDQLLAGQTKLTITPRQPRKTGSVELSEPALETIRDELSMVKSREEGVAYLDRLRLSRAALHQIAISLDVPVRKSDKVDEVRSNIVETVIGFKLRSKAIREL